MKKFFCDLILFASSKQMITGRGGGGDNVVILKLL